MHHKINGGSSETDANEFAVTPTGSPSGRRALTTVTPVAKALKASRSSRGEIVSLTVLRNQSWRGLAIDYHRSHAVFESVGFEGSAARIAPRPPDIYVPIRFPDVMGNDSTDGYSASCSIDTQDGRCCRR